MWIKFLLQVILEEFLFLSSWVASDIRSSQLERLLHLLPRSMTTDPLSSPPTFSCFLNERFSPPTADGLILSLPILRKQVVISCSRDVPLQCQYSAITFSFSLTPPNPTASWFCAIERERAVVLRQHDGWQTRVGPLSGSPPRAPPDGDFNVWRGKRSLGHSAESPVNR